MHDVPEKEEDLPRCRRRNGPCVRADAWVGTDRVRPVNNPLGRMNERHDPWLHKSHASTTTRFLAHRRDAAGAAMTRPG